MKEAKVVKIVRTYSESLKLKAVKEIESGVMNQSEAARYYGCTKGAVNFWMRKYSNKLQQTKVIRVGMKSESDKIRELESALAKAHMKLDVYEKMMELAKENDGIEVKKNTSTGEYEVYKDGRVLNRTAKS